MSKRIVVLTIMHLAFYLSIQAQKFTDFRFTSDAIGWEADFEGVIDDTDRTITFTTQQWIENIAELRATFTLDNGNYDVKVGNVTQVSGVTTNDFRREVIYTINGDVEYAIIFASPQSSGLPVIKIDTKDGAAIVNKVNYVNMTFDLTDPNHPDNNISVVNTVDGIRGRGNDSWNNPNAIKKSYRIKFDKKTSLFGLEAAKSWVLHAQYRDPTLLFNAIAFELGNRFELPFNHTFHFVELYLNDRYMGNYMLTEQNQVGEGRVDIDENEGWFVELDGYYDEEPKFKTENYTLQAMIKSPEVDPTVISNPAYDFVREDINNLCDSMASVSFPENGYRDLININTFIDFLMITEIVDNKEIQAPMSTYIYKNKNDVINMGPLWDFDCGYGYGYNYIHFANPNKRTPMCSFFKRFFEDPVFLVNYKERWNEKYSDIVSINDFIDETANNLEKSAVENFKTWWYRVISPWWTSSRPVEENDFRQQISNIQTYLSKQILYLNTELNKVEILPTSKDFGAAAYNFEVPTQIFTLVSYGEISNLAVSLQKGTSSNFEISDTQTEETGKGGYLVKISVKPKAGLPIGTYSDKLIVSGKNQGNTFNLEASVSFAVREASEDATLKKIEISDGTLSPVFAANITEYTVNVTTPTITITGEANHVGATVDNVTDHPLDLGENEITITVTAEDGVTTKEYTINVTRSSSDDTTLKSLTVSSGILSPEFDANVTEYTVNVTTPTITITGDANHIGATVDNVTDHPLVSGENTIEIIVTAEDGISNETYTITVDLRVATASVAVDPETVTLAKGETQQFSALVTYVGNDAIYRNLVVNEVSGEHKFVEIYNTGSDEISLNGVKLQRNDGPSAGGSEWVGTIEDKIPAGAYRIFLFNSYKPANLTDNQAYVGWTVGSGISDQQILKVAIVDPSGNEVSVFIRGDNPLPAWGTPGATRNQAHSYSRMGDGSWAYAVPTPGAENGNKEGNIIGPGYLSTDAVTWTLSGNTSTATTINTNGLLTVAADETATTFTVTATSVIDITKKASSTITVLSDDATSDVGVGGVTIGSIEDPQVFSILELISNGSKGLRLPQLTTAQRDAMTTSTQFIAAKNTTAMGLLIFNTTTRCMELWNGSVWVSFSE